MFEPEKLFSPAFDLRRVYEGKTCARARGAKISLTTEDAGQNKRVDKEGTVFKESPFKVRLILETLQEVR